MRLPEAVARDRFATARVMRLATADADGRPHLVPAVFAVRDGLLVTAVDAKPKRHQRLRRLANIAARPAVSALVDVYRDDDWRRLWWVRADGLARVLDGGSERAAEAVARLVEKYPQYRHEPPRGPVVEITVTRWSGWAADG
ncbi:TIGR03668 family PPOX class F420-dependent oxidoreductase [Streptomyces sp. 4N509B]|uniref:TIGR03668 family PPOX class F420-dependent oxidoreductase n=1 Tax=Streptomyces sp. 4N509B TaxID=3457413 RepID=UPI003FD4FABA